MQEEKAEFMKIIGVFVIGAISKFTRRSLEKDGNGLILNGRIGKYWNQ